MINNVIIDDTPPMKKHEEGAPPAGARALASV